MRGWLIGVNVLLGTTLVVALVAGSLLVRSQAEQSSSSGVSVGPEPVEETPTEKTADFARSLGVQTLMAIKASARDPESVRFRDVFTVNLGDDTDRLILICGQVTGRNGFSGYSGFVPFVASSERDVKFSGMAGFDSFYNDCIHGTPVAPVYL